MDVASMFRSTAELICGFVSFVAISVVARDNGVTPYAGQAFGACRPRGSQFADPAIWWKFGDAATTSSPLLLRYTVVCTRCKIGSAARSLDPNTANQHGKKRRILFRFLLRKHHQTPDLLIRDHRLRIGTAMQNFPPSLHPKPFPNPHLPPADQTNHTHC